MFYLLQVLNSDIFCYRFQLLGASPPHSHLDSLAACSQRQLVLVTKVIFSSVFSVHHFLRCVTTATTERLLNGNCWISCFCLLLVLIHVIFCLCNSVLLKLKVAVLIGWHINLTAGVSANYVLCFCLVHHYFEVCGNLEVMKKRINFTNLNEIQINI